ncbi:MAG: patatin-like phospholipase family protein [Bacteroidia bacterium]|nr:patatin-like phospholipase family protein [Bacteroidia bacterium]MBP9688823.1 patatin-like phospholipase family protein [Bacteroidia bacterium]
MINPPNEDKRYKLGIVLSGGGARGYAHIGVLKALNQNGIYPDVISATSAGSIVGALYADGYTPDEIFEIFAKVDVYKLLSFYKPVFGLLKVDGLKKTLQQQLKAQLFNDLKLPLYVCATNFTKAHVQYFTNGDLITPIMASCAIPMVLKPVLIDGDFYVDGGLMNNLPVEPLVSICDEIIGVNVNPVNEVKKFKSIRNYADRVMHLAVRANVEPNISKCDVYIEPPGLMDYHLFKVSAAQQIFEIGYNHTQSIIHQIKEDLF